MFTLLWGLLLWFIFVMISCGVLLVVYAPIVVPAILISGLIDHDYPDAADVVWIIALILCIIETLVIAYQLGSVYG